MALATQFVASSFSAAGSGLTCPALIRKPGAPVGVWKGRASAPPKRNPNFLLIYFEGTGSAGLKPRPSGAQKRTFQQPVRAASLAAAADAAVPLSREIIDRVVASIDNVAITQSEVEAEYRIELFLEEGRLPVAPSDAATFERIRDRLIDQKLLAQEAAAEQIEPAAFRNLAKQRLGDIRKKPATEEAFQSALRSLGMNEYQLLERLEEQERTLRLIDQRMRPLVSVEHGEIETYYRETFLPEYARHNKGLAPALADVENQVREILVQKKIDQRLEAWLKELRSNHRVRVYGMIE